MTVNERIEQWFSGREDELVAALTPLVAIDSTTGPAQPGKPFGPGPAAALEAALKLAQSWGLATSDDQGYVGLVDLNDFEDQLHILAHLDIVGAGDHWDTDPFTLVRDGDLIYGRGTDDDKGPAVAAMMALRCVKELGLPLTRNAKLVLGTDEESGSGDIAHYYAHHPYAPNSITPDSNFPVTNIEKTHYCPEFSAHWEKPQKTGRRLVSLEGGIRVNVAPANGAAFVSGLTAAEVSPVLEQVQKDTGVTLTARDQQGGVALEAIGVQAHASTPDEGKNAITALLTAVAALPLEEDGAFATAKALHQLFPYGDNRGEALGIAMADEASGQLTLTLSLLKITDTGFEGQFDVRAPICATRDNCAQVVEDRFHSLGWSCTGDFGHAHVVEADSDFIRTLLDCYEHFSGKKGYCEAIGGGTYVHEIPGGVAFGAGDVEFDSRLHGANERARLSQLLMCGKIYAAVIARLCA